MFPALEVFKKQIEWLDYVTTHGLKVRPNTADNDMLENIKSALQPAPDEKPVDDCDHEFRLHHGSGIKICKHCRRAETPSLAGAADAKKAMKEAVKRFDTHPQPQAPDEKPVAWQYQLKDGRWSNMPGDWTPDEDALGRHTYRPLFTQPQKQTLGLTRDVYETLPAMPETYDRKPFDDGYLEGNLDWARNNSDAVTWLADNHIAIRAALQAVQPQSTAVKAEDLAKALMPRLFSDDVKVAHRAASPYAVAFARQKEIDRAQVILDKLKALQP